MECSSCCAAGAPSKAGSVAGSIDTAASIGSNAVATTLAVGSIGGGAETPGPVGLEEVMRQLQEKYTLWQQRLDANIGQVGVTLVTCMQFLRMPH